MAPNDPVHWSTLASDFGGGIILVGNGASRAVWDRFGYDSLWTTARDEIDDPLDDRDKELFRTLGTRNFERVLAALSLSRKVTTTLGLPVAAGKLEQRYNHIQSALAQAVHRVHVPWERVQGTTVLAQILAALASYKFVYSTNYDLLIYWAMMSVPSPPAKDYFWNSTTDSNYFDDDDTTITGPGALYLHGALHLFARSDNTHKRLSSVERGTLLDQFGQPLQPDDIPLIVTEGDAPSKEQSIRASDYLSFAHEQFTDDERALVVFGHSLDASDAHLVEAVNAHPDRAVAVSVHMGDDWAVYCEGLRKRLNAKSLRFFDAASHPLGAPSLSIPLA